MLVHVTLIWTYYFQSSHLMHLVLKEAWISHRLNFFLFTFQLPSLCSKWNIFQQNKLYSLSLIFFLYQLFSRFLVWASRNNVWRLKAISISKAKRQWDHCSVNNWLLRTERYLHFKVTYIHLCLVHCILSAPDTFF